LNVFNDLTGLPPFQYATIPLFPLFRLQRFQRLSRFCPFASSEALLERSAPQGRNAAPPVPFIFLFTIPLFMFKYRLLNTDRRRLTADGRLL
jgi:hypothetical protein